MINAAIQPGTHPRMVRIEVMSTDPHPLSITAKGGHIMHNRALQNDIVVRFIWVDDYTLSFTWSRFSDLRL